MKSPISKLFTEKDDTRMDTLRSEIEARLALKPCGCCGPGCFGPPRTGEYCEIGRLEDEDLLRRALASLPSADRSEGITQVIAEMREAGRYARNFGNGNVAAVYMEQWAKRLESLAPSQPHRTEQKELRVSGAETNQSEARNQPRPTTGNPAEREGQ